MTALTRWRADFMNDPPDLDRRRWPTRRDLHVTVLAVDENDARVQVFKIAHKLLIRPYLGALEKDTNGSS